jgi:hypothetical protein
LVVRIDGGPHGGDEGARLLEVGKVPGVVDEGEWPAELGTHRLRG